MSSLDLDLIRDFVKVTQPKEEIKIETIVYGKIVKQSDATYVQIDGADTITPVLTTASVKNGERVTVMIKNHQAVVTGNLTDPASSATEVKEVVAKVGEFTTVVTDKIQAESARIDTIVAENVTIKEKLTASEAVIADITATNVTIKGELEAAKATITEIKTNKLDAEAADIKFATIESLKATNGEFYNLKSTYAEFEKLITGKIEATEAIVEDLKANTITVDNLNGKFANIDFANIGKAAIEEFFAKSGIIKDLVVDDVSVTGELVGVKISGDLIKGNTIIADKLVIKGEDGLYYKLNTDGVTTELEQTDYNSLNGQVIQAKSITAEKVNVSDLVAFDATIGGFKITSNAIYSGVKETVHNSTRGIYLDNDGQVSIGDASNKIMYYLNTSGEYKLYISADDIYFGADKLHVSTAISNAAKTATNFLEFNSTNGLLIGNKSNGSWSGYRSRITGSSFDILNSGGTVLASYGANTVELGKNSTSSIIKMCGGKATLRYIAEDSTNYVELISKYIRVRSDTMTSLYAYNYNGKNTAYKSAVNTRSGSIEIFSQVSTNIDPTTEKGTFTTSNLKVDPMRIYMDSGADIQISAKEIISMSTTIGTISLSTSESGGIYLKSPGVMGINITGKTTINGQVYANKFVGPLTVTGFGNDSYGQVRIVHGNYGLFLRNDGKHTYFLLTARGNQYGIWNSLRPFYIDNTNGYVVMNNGATISALAVESTIKAKGAGSWIACNQFASSWIGFYTSHGGTRKAWIGHNGTNDFHIKNESSNVIRLANDVYVGGGGVMLTTTGASRSISTIWSDGAKHDIISVASDNRTTYIGAGSYTGNTAQQTNLRGYKVHIYTHGGTLTSNKAISVSSDRNVKHDIESLDERYIQFFKDLKPMKYKYNTNKFGRTHMGFIAQEIEEALLNNGLTTKEFAGLVIDDNFMDPDESSPYHGIAMKRYFLRYEEFIALNTRVIQIHDDEITKLKEEVKELKIKLNAYISGEMEVNTWQA